MSVFKSLTNLHPKRAFSEKGFKKDIQKYDLLVNKKTGKEELVPTEKEPFYLQIQEQVEGQLLETLIRRYQINLNDKHITQLKAEVVDMTQYPDDLLEAHALIHQLENQFKECSADVKNYFEDFSGYIRSFQNGTLKSDLENIVNIQKGRKVAQSAPITGNSSVTGTTSAHPSPTIGTTIVEPVQTTITNNGGHF